MTLFFVALGLLQSGTPVRYLCDENLTEGTSPFRQVTNLVPMGELRVLKTEGHTKQFSVGFGKRQSTWTPPEWGHSPALKLRIAKWEFRTIRDESGTLVDITKSGKSVDCPTFENHPFAANTALGKLAVVSSIMSESTKGGLRVNYRLQSFRSASGPTRVLSDADRANLWIDVLDPFLADSSWAAAALKRLEKKEQVTYQVLGYRLIPLAVHLELGGKQQVTYKSWTRELALLKIFDAPAIAKKRKQVGFALLDKDGNLVLGRCGIGLLPAALISREDSDVPHRACWPPFRPAYDVQSIPNEDGQGG